MITLKDVHNQFDNIRKMPLFEIEILDGYDLVDISKSEDGLAAYSEYGNFEALFNEFDYCDNASECLDMLLNELYMQVINKHCELGILV